MKSNNKNLWLYLVLFFILNTYVSAQNGFLELKWKNVGFNFVPGKSELICEDIDKDGQQEILLDFNYGQYFAVMEYKDNDYQFKWISPLYEDDVISEIKVYDINSDSEMEICVLHSSGKLDVFNAATMVKDTTLNITFSNVASFDIDDIDNDGIVEFIIGKLSYSNYASLYILNSLTLEQEWSLTNIFVNDWDIEIGDVDNDLINEIVLSNGLVIDGVDHKSNWNYVQGFGNKIALGDVDGDGVKEIISLSNYYDINAFDAESKSPLWSITSSEDLNTLYVTDIENDGYAEIIVGNNQWGDISCYNAFTKKIIWAVGNPTHGSTNITLGDPDNDGNSEVIWSAGESTSGPDYLHIGDVEQEVLVWTSMNMDGPFYVDIFDLNKDGFKEIFGTNTTTDNNYGSGQIFIYNSSTYNMEWNSGDPNPNYWRFSSIKVGNIDSSKQDEIIVASGSNLYIFDSESHSFRNTSISTNNSYYEITTLEVSDIDNDDVVEIVIGDEQGYLHIINGETLEEEWHSVKINGSVEKIILADFDADEAKEIAVLNYLGYITVYDGITHLVEWQSNIINNLTTFDISDVDRDGTKEIIIGTQNGQILLIDILSKNITDTLGNIGETISGLEVENIDMDSSVEIIVGGTKLYVFDAYDKSKEYESEFLGNSTGFRNNLIVTDVENDHHMDIFASNNRGIFQFRCSNTFPDIIPPYVVSNHPKNNATQVTTSTSIKIIFSEDVNEATLTPDNLKILANDTLIIHFSFEYSPLTRTIEITTDSLLPGIASVEVLFSGNISDIALNGLDGNKNDISEGSPDDDYILHFITGSGRDIIFPSFINVNINKNELWPGFDIKIEATVSDISDVSFSQIEYAECFIDSITTAGTGKPFYPKDGLFNSPIEEVELTIPTSNWFAGEHTLYLVAKDIEGNSGGITIPVNVLSQDKMTANWPMLGQNPQHTGSNVNDSINLPLNIKWSKKIFNNPLNQVVVADNIVYATENNSQTPSKVISLNAETGETIWTYEIWGNSYVKTPSYYKGRLYVPMVSTPNYGYLLVIDASNGELLWETSIGYRFGPYATIADDKLFIAYEHGNFYAFSALERKYLWRSDIYSTRYDWVPAYAKGNVYTCGEGSSYCAYDADSGYVISSTGSPMVGQTPVIKDNVIYTSSPVSAINLEDNNVLWKKTGSMPAAAYGKVFMISGDSLYVLDELSGVTLWTFKTNSTISRPPVISNSNVFLSTTTRLLAINIDTHLETWSYNQPGEVVVANNKLYLCTSGGYVICFQESPVSVKNEFELPSDYELMQNYPNPFNPETTIKYALPVASHVRMEIYNGLGQLVKILVNSEKPTGYHEIKWNASEESSGVYFYRIITGNYIKTEKMLLLK